MTDGCLLIPSFFASLSYLQEVFQGLRFEGSILDASFCLTDPRLDLFHVAMVFVTDGAGPFGLVLLILHGCQHFFAQQFQNSHVPVNFSRFGLFQLRETLRSLVGQQTNVLLESLRLFVQVLQQRQMTTTRRTISRKSMTPPFKVTGKKSGKTATMGSSKKPRPSWMGRGGAAESTATKNSRSSSQRLAPRGPIRVLWNGHCNTGRTTFYGEMDKATDQRQGQGQRFNRSLRPANQYSCRLTTQAAAAGETDRRGSVHVRVSSLFLLQSFTPHGSTPSHTVSE